MKVVIIISNVEMPWWRSETHERIYRYFQGFDFSFELNSLCKDIFFILQFSFLLNFPLIKKFCGGDNAILRWARTNPMATPMVNQHLTFSAWIQSTLKKKI